MSRLRHLRLLALVSFAGILCRLAGGQAMDSAAGLWLHAWVPETGTIADSASPLDRSLGQVAELARHGDFNGALRLLDSIQSPEASAGYLTRIFRREVLLRSTFAIGGVADQQSEGGFFYIRNAQQGERLTEEAAQLARQAGPAHEQQLNAANNVATYFDLCAIQAVANLRIDQINRETAELKALAAPPSVQDPHLVCAQAGFTLKQFQALDPVTTQLLDLWMAARYEEGRWNFSAAEDCLVQGLALARSRAPGVAGLWLLALGDLEIAPYGSPLTFGFDSSTDSGVRVTITAGVRSKSLAGPLPDAIARAEDDYRQSDRPEAELAIRKAYIAWVRTGRNSAPAYASAATAAGPAYPALHAISQAARGFLLADKQYFTAGLHEAQASGSSGLAISLADMADSVASRLQTSDPIRAVGILDFAAIAASGEGLPASAARLELSLAFDNNALGRSDFAIDAWERAVAHIQTWMAQTDKISQQEKLESVLRPGLVLAHQQRLIGVLIQLAGALRRASSSMNADPSFQRRIDAALIEAEAALEDAAASLLVLQSLQTESQELQTLQNGVMAGDSDSVRLAMLLRQQGVSEITPQQHQQIASLEARLRPPTLSPGAEVADVKLITDRIPAGAVVLAYYPARTRVLIWRLEKGKPPLLRHSSATPWTIGRMADDLSRHLLDQVAGWEGAAKSLYNELVEPAGNLEPGSTVAISGMPSVPFDLLGPTGGEPLIREHPIVYLTGLASPAAGEGATPAGTTAVVAGAMGAVLVEVNPEVEAVARLLHTVPLVDGNATLSRVRMELPSARFVHIASHGVIDSANPYRSYLALTDGHLEAWDLFHSAPKADLVVFSACDTLRPIARKFGDDFTTIGGLTTLGGAPRVLSSRWEADDRDARKLMELFYENLKTSPAMALQRAKIALGAFYRSANFILTVASPGAIETHSQP